VASDSIFLMVTNFSTNVMKLLKFKISDYDDPDRTPFTTTQYRWKGNTSGYDTQHHVNMFLIGDGRLRFVYPGSGSYSELDVDFTTSDPSSYTMKYVYPIQERGYTAGISYAVSSTDSASGDSEVRTLFAGHNSKEFMTNTGRVATKVRMGVVMPDNQNRTCLVYGPQTESVTYKVKEITTQEHGDSSVGSSEYPITAS